MKNFMLNSNDAVNYEIGISLNSEIEVINTASNSNWNRMQATQEGETTFKHVRRVTGGSLFAILMMFGFLFIPNYNVMAGEFLDEIPPGWATVPSPCDGRNENERILWQPSDMDYYHIEKTLEYYTQDEYGNNIYIGVRYTVRYVYRILPDGMLEIQILQVVLLPDANNDKMLLQIPKELLIAFAFETLFQEYEYSKHFTDEQSLELRFPKKGPFDDQIVRTTIGSCWKTKRICSYYDYLIPMYKEDLRLMPYLFPKTLINSDDSSESVIYRPEDELIESISKSKHTMISAMLGDSLFTKTEYDLSPDLSSDTNMVSVFLSQPCDGVECCSQLFEVSRDANGKVTMKEIEPPKKHNCSALSTQEVFCQGVCDWSNFVTDHYGSIKNDYYNIIDSNPINTELINNKLIFKISDEIFNNNLRFEIREPYGNIKFNKEIFITSENNIVSSDILSKGNYICGVFLNNRLLYFNIFIVE